MDSTRFVPSIPGAVRARGPRAVVVPPAAGAGETSRTLRAALRACRLAVVVGCGLAAFLWLMARHRGRPPRAARARWLQGLCRRGLRVFGVRLTVEGTAPERGLLVGNHLSYLDILVLGAVRPSVFVSKSEVRRWPVFGACAALAGTIFLRRTRRRDVGRVLDEMRRALADGALVVLFPEGTTTDGSGVLPFKSSLLEPAAAEGHPVAALRLDYTLGDGVASEEVCYWRDMVLLPHLWNLLGKERIEARVRFGHTAAWGGLDRRELARRLHGVVSRLAGGSV